MLERETKIHPSFVSFLWEAKLLVMADMQHTFCGTVNARFDSWKESHGPQPAADDGLLVSYCVVVTLLQTVSSTKHNNTLQDSHSHSVAFVLHQIALKLERNATGKSTTA